VNPGPAMVEAKASDRVFFLKREGCKSITFKLPKLKYNSIDG